jgi:hypothetical protein
MPTVIDQITRGAATEMRGAADPASATHDG